MLYRSQTALAVMCLDDVNRTSSGWRVGQEWHQLDGSSKAMFARKARVKAGINPDEYLKILRENMDAIETAEEISDEFDEPWKIK